MVTAYARLTDSGQSRALPAEIRAYRLAPERKVLVIAMAGETFSTIRASLGRAARMERKAPGFCDLDYAHRLRSPMSTLARCGRTGSERHWIGP